MLFTGFVVDPQDDLGSKYSAATRWVDAPTPTLAERTDKLTTNTV